jgi:hypothetical protein
VIIDDLNLTSVAPAPYKAEPPPIVDPDAVLASAAAMQFLQAIAGRNSQVLQRLRVVQHRELATRGVLDTPKARTALAVEERFGVLASERLNHPRYSITDYVRRQETGVTSGKAVAERPHLEALFCRARVRDK